MLALKAPLCLNTVACYRSASCSQGLSVFPVHKPQLCNFKNIQSGSSDSEFIMKLFSICSAFTPAALHSEVRGHPADGADGPCSFYVDFSSHEAVLLLLLCPGAERLSVWSLTFPSIIHTSSSVPLSKASEAASQISHMTWLCVYALNLNSVLCRCLNKC